VRFAINIDWDKAVLAVLLAGLLDGIDGRIARLLKAQSRFGAELDSLSDSLSFGMAPALILFLWSLEQLPRFGWFASLIFALSCALRLARFNARIDIDDQPHKSAGFLTGVPAPLGGALGFLPMFLWLASGEEIFRNPIGVAIWTIAIAFLMISNIATLSWTSMRPRRGGAVVGDPVGRDTVHRLAHRAVVDAGGDLPGLSRADALRHRQLCQGQAAARRAGCGERSGAGRLSGLGRRGVPACRATTSI
jgi:CDP-diacylglycerol--serine O-phosphatidyltransferase